jgi:hypothetical protein
MNKFLLSTKFFLLGLKYNYLFIKSNYLVKRKTIDSVKKFKKKNKIVICGNGPSYKIFEKEKLKGKYENYDTLMLNWGAIQTKIDINYHIFEMPRKQDVVADYIQKIENLTSNVCRIFRPNNMEEILKIKNSSLKNIHILKEKRIRQNNKSILYKDLRQFSSSNILFCRSSIVYATLFALKLGYTELLYVGINPDTSSSWCSNSEGSQEYHKNRVIQKGDIHATFKKVNRLNSYDILKLISNFDLFKKIKFKIDPNSYDFIS